MQTAMETQQQEGHRAAAETTPQTVRLEEIGQIALTVGDLQRAKAFYQDVLGMKFLFEAGTMAFFQCGAVRLMIGLGEQPVTRSGTLMYFRVPEIAAVCEQLKLRGVKFLEAPHLVASLPDHDLWMAFLRDPDRNTIGLMSEVPRGGALDS